MPAERVLEKPAYTDMNLDNIQVFDPNQGYSVLWRKLPHWAQAGTICFITWRTNDSMPRKVVEKWIAERNALLLREGLKVNDAGYAGICEARRHWKQLVQRLAQQVQWKLQCELTDQFEYHLDACHGACLLRLRELAEIVGESLMKFSGQRYELTDFVVMPNHVHILVAFRDEDEMIKQCSNWKRFTARKINAAIGRRDEFWQEDAFDHLVRSPDHFDHYRKYIADNGPRAKLPPTDYLAYSRA